MAVRIQNLPKKSFDQSSFHSMTHFTVSCPTWWNSSEQQITESFSKTVSLKVDSPPQGKHLGLQLPDQESSSTQSIGQSQSEVDAVGGTNSQDQCISSESGQDESGGKVLGRQMKPVFLLGNPEIVFNPSQVDHGRPLAHVPYPYAEPYFGGLYTPYGPQAVIQPQLGPQMVGITPARVALPLDLADDGPIYVNAKQYHGILRRRQSRAKLEAQNRLVKTRKPYLHESRHLHALNRIRGSGGRFLSKKKVQQPDAAPITNRNSEFGSRHTGTGEYDVSNTRCSDVTSVSNSVVFQQPDLRFSGISPHVAGGMQGGSGGLICSGTQRCPSVVR